MTEQPLAAWWEAISGARWFAGKGLSATLAELTPLPWLTPIGQLPAVRPEIATIRYAGGADEQYLLLVGYTTEPEGAVVGSVTEPGLGAVHVVQASADGACMRALLRALTDPEHPAMEWLDASAIDPEAPSRVWRGDQSNTTICLAEDRLFKLFRKLEPGRNLDVEVLAALSGSEVTPALYGTLVGELPAAGRPTWACSWNASRASGTAGSGLARCAPTNATSRPRRPTWAGRWPRCTRGSRTPSAPPQPPAPSWRRRW